MSLTAAMITGFTGIQSNSMGVDTVGNNLANLNTTAFKSERTTFETLLYRTITEGEAPSSTGGGSLPRQIGTGSTVSAIQRNFVQGGMDVTTFQNDLFINGDGFFVLENANGQQFFTRDGAFHIDAAQTLVSANGQAVQIFSADASGNINTGSLTNLVIPLGSSAQAVSTTQVNMAGQLDPNTTIAGAGSILSSQPLLIASGTAATDTTLLTDLVNASGIPLFSDGDELTIGGSRGGISITESMYTVGTTGTTLGDLTTYMEQTLGINTDPTLGTTAGITIADGTTGTPAGSMVIASNDGQINAIQLDSASIINTTGAITAPFTFTLDTASTGQGVTTSFGVFDSLGNLVEVRLRMTLESKSNTGVVWRFYAESVSDSDLSPVLGTGTITFDPNGQYVTASGTNITIDRAGTGSATTVNFTLDFSDLTGLTSPNGTSKLVLADQNGAPTGLMQGYRIEENGTVVGLFTNQQEQVIGQIALATFVNNEGLVAQSENTFLVGPDAGSPTISTPLTGRAGFVISGALEQSNVEIAREFINLITFSTGVSSASRVVRVADDLLQELLLLAR